MQAKLNMGSIANTPLIPDEVYETLPTFLKDCCSHFNGRERDALLTAALAVISGMLPSVTGRYDKFVFHAMLFAVICAPPASGKGVVIFARLLAEAYHKFLSEQADSTNPESKDRSTNSSFIMPADSSAAMFLSLLKNNGGKGLFIETEVDSLVNSFAQEWGTYDVNLRKAFQHETISYARKTDNQNITITHPMLAMVLAGTMGQVRKLLPSTENGLFSRIMFYAFVGETKWRSPKPEDNTEDTSTVFLKLGEDLFILLQKIEQKKIQFRFTDEQWVIFNTFFSATMDLFPITHGDDARGVVSRLGLIVFRIAMVLSALRYSENQVIEDCTLVCQSLDFNNAMRLGKIYKEHARIMMEVTPDSTALGAMKLTDLFYKALPLKFRRAEAVEIGAKMKIPERSVGRYLNLFLSNSMLTRPTVGQYHKPI